MGQVAAAVEVHAHEHVAGLAQREIDGDVGLAAGVRLHVGVLRAEELAGPAARDVLDHVDVLAAAVVALAGITLGVLVGQPAADCLHDGGRGEVLTGDKLYVVALTAELLLHHGVYLFVGRAKMCKVHVVIPQECNFVLCRQCRVLALYHLPPLCANTIKAVKQACVCVMCTNERHRETRAPC